jgi:cytochrome P450
MSRIANELLTDSKAMATGTGEKRGGRDLLSLLVRANMETELPPTQRMSDQDVLARTWPSCYHSVPKVDHLALITEVPTFFVAGHETTRLLTCFSTSLT